MWLMLTMCIFAVALVFSMLGQGGGAHTVDRGVLEQAEIGRIDISQTLLGECLEQAGSHDLMGEAQ